MGNKLFSSFRLLVAILATLCGQVVTAQTYGGALDGQKLIVNQIMVNGNSSVCADSATLQLKGTDSMGQFTFGLTSVGPIVPCSGVRIPQNNYDELSGMLTVFRVQIGLNNLSEPTIWANMIFTGNNQFTVTKYGYLYFCAQNNTNYTSLEEYTSGCVAPPAPTCQVNAYGVCMYAPTAGAYKKNASGQEVPATESDFTWNPTAKVWMANIGVKITAPQQVTCKNVGDETTWADGHRTPDGTDCWKRASADGTVKFASSGVSIPSEPTRKVMFAYYTVFANGYLFHQRFPVWQDSNTAALVNSPASNGGSTQVFDYSYGSSDGFVVHSQTGCGKRIWDNSVNNFNTIPVICNF